LLPPVRQSIAARFCERRLKTVIRFAAAGRCRNRRSPVFCPFRCARKDAMRVVIAQHPGDIPSGTLREICRQAGWEWPPKA